MKFELENPSDPYTLEADDLQVAAVACCILGNGKYGLTGIGDDVGQDVPIFLFGGHDEWFESKFGMNYDDTATHALNNRNDALARAFESVTLGREPRSSLNDIRSQALDIAQAIRRKDKELHGEAEQAALLDVPAQEMGASANTGRELDDLRLHPETAEIRAGVGSGPECGGQVARDCGDAGEVQRA